MEPKFGDRMRGVYASEDNPQRDGIYVETIIRRGSLNSGKFYRITDGEGNFWEYPAHAAMKIRPHSTTAKNV